MDKGIKWKPISPAYGEYMKSKDKRQRRKRLGALGVRGFQKDVLSHYIDLFQRRSADWFKNKMRKIPKKEALRVAKMLRELAEETKAKLDTLGEKAKKKEQEKLSAIAGIRRVILRKKKEKK